MIFSPGKTITKAREIRVCRLVLALIKKGRMLILPYKVDCTVMKIYKKETIKIPQILPA